MAETQQRTLWQRFTERKFLVPIIVFLAIAVMLITGLVPLTLASLAALGLGIVPVVLFMVTEGRLDLQRLKSAVPDVPGPADDIVRALLAFADAYSKNPDDLENAVKLLMVEILKFRNDAKPPDAPRVTDKVVGTLEAKPLVKVDPEQ